MPDARDAASIAMLEKGTVASESISSRRRRASGTSRWSGRVEVARPANPQERPRSATEARPGRPPSAPSDLAQTPASPWRSSRQRCPVQRSRCSSGGGVRAARNNAPARRRMRASQLCPAGARSSRDGGPSPRGASPAAAGTLRPARRDAPRPGGSSIAIYASARSSVSRTVASAGPACSGSSAAGSRPRLRATPPARAHRGSPACLSAPPPPAEPQRDRGDPADRHARELDRLSGHDQPHDRLDQRPFGECPAGRSEVRGPLVLRAPGACVRRSGSRARRAGGRDGHPCHRRRAPRRAGRRRSRPRPRLRTPAAPCRASTGAAPRRGRGRSRRRAGDCRRALDSHRRPSSGS